MAPCPSCGVKLMKHRGGPHGLAHHDCMAVTPEMRLRLHTEVVQAVMAADLSPQRARAVMLRMLVMRAYEAGSSVREIGDALEKVTGAMTAGESGGDDLAAMFGDDDED